jgi:hypothetical protein
MIFAPEFGRVLRQNLRGGNTLADILRELYDSGRARVKQSLSLAAHAVNGDTRRRIK